MGIATYVRAMKAGQKEYKTCVSMGWDPYLPALEKQITNADIAGEEPLGLMSIPMERIAGTRNTARRDCFSASFLQMDVFFQMEMLHRERDSLGSTD